MATDKVYGEFDDELQDEYTFDAHPPPGIEIGYEDASEQGPLDLERDSGSGSMAEDGRVEVRQDPSHYDGENAMLYKDMMGAAAAADRPGSELGGAYEDGYGDAFYKRGYHGSGMPDEYDRGFSDATRDTAVGAAAAADRPGSELGAGLYPVDGASELGWEDDAVGKTQKAVAAAEHAVKKAAVAVKTQPPHVAAQHVAAAHAATQRAQHALASGPYASHGPVEIGAGEDTLGTDALTQPFETFMLTPERLGDEEVGTHYPTQGASELGAGLYPVDGASELGAGLYPVDGASELGAGLYPVDGASELGSAAMYGPTEIGSAAMYGPTEIGAGFEGWDDALDEYPVEASEIGEAAQKAAVVKAVEKARDSRQPAPPMKAVDVDAPLDEDEESFISDIVLGATVAAPTGAEPFPLLTQLLVRAGSGMAPRVVRVDTEESYKAWRTAQSPALSKVSELADKIEAHISDPNAHELDSEDIDDDIADLVHLGEEAKAAEASKRVELWMPTRFDGKVEAWKQDDMVCCSLALPGRDGCVRICTSFEPVVKCVEEMTRHASEANVSQSIVGVLPAMGCVLGAGTVMKEVAAAAPAILARPEAQVKMPFVVRIEPKTSPNLAALVMLAAACKLGNQQACSEWQKLADMSAPQVKAAMVEAAQVAKAATEV